jgi:integrase
MKKLLDRVVRPEIGRDLFERVIYSRLAALPLRYRKPYNSRHSLISWRLMIGHNRLLVAQEAGHSVSTMERAYAAWITGANPEDIERIKAAMASRPFTENAGEDRTISKHSNIPRQVATV